MKILIAPCLMLLLGLLALPIRAGAQNGTHIPSPCPGGGPFELLGSETAVAAASYNHSMAVMQDGTPINLYCRDEQKIYEVHTTLAGGWEIQNRYSSLGDTAYFFESVAPLAISDIGGRRVARLLHVREDARCPGEDGDPGFRLVLSSIDRAVGVNNLRELPERDLGLCVDWSWTELRGRFDTRDHLYPQVIDLRAYAGELRFEALVYTGSGLRMLSVPETGDATLRTVVNFDFENGTGYFTGACGESIVRARFLGDPSAGGHAPKIAILQSLPRVLIADMNQSTPSGAMRLRVVYDDGRRSEQDECPREIGPSFDGRDGFDYDQDAHSLSWYVHSYRQGRRILIRGRY